jgi:hypothetical protein
MQSKRVHLRHFVHFATFLLVEFHISEYGDFRFIAVHDLNYQNESKNSAIFYIEYSLTKVFWIKSNFCFTLLWKERGVLMKGKKIIVSVANRNSEENTYK